MKILQFIVINIVFILMMFVESSFAVNTNENRNVSKLTLLQEIDDVIKAEESLGNDQEKIKELKKAREQYEETLKTIKLMRNKIALLKEKVEVQNKYTYNVPVKNKQKDSQSIYTIQTGSFVNIEGAQKQFNSLIKILNEEDNNYLRIEKIGKVYSVRVGSFNDHATAKSFLMATKSPLNMAIILKAFIKEDRIIRSHKDLILSTR